MHFFGETGFAKVCTTWALVFFLGCSLFLSVPVPSQIWPTLGLGWYNKLETIGARSDVQANPCDH
jgi:hypothetical protein